jgi:hypothetical protein
VKEASVEQTDNILWLLKQAWYFSLTTVNDAVSWPPSPACPVPTWRVDC